MAYKAFGPMISNKIFQQVIFMLVLLLFWSGAKHFLLLPDYILPSPWTVFCVFEDNGAYVISHMTITLLEALTGLFVAIVLGFLLGLATSLIRGITSASMTFFTILQAIPIVAVAPLFVLWLGSGMQSKIGMVSLMCLFPVAISTIRGLGVADQNFSMLMQTLKASRAQSLIYIGLPSSLPYILNGVKISASMSIIGAIVAEYSGADKGIGYVITQAVYRLDTPMLFAGVCAAACGGILLVFFFTCVENYVAKKFSA